MKGLAILMSPKGAPKAEDSSEDVSSVSEDRVETMREFINGVKQGAEPADMLELLDLLLAQKVEE